MPHPMLSAFRALPDVRHVLDQVGRTRLVDFSASDGSRPFLVAALARQAEAIASGSADAAPLVVVTATTREAEDLETALGLFLPSERIAVFPSWETLPHERLSPRSDTVGRRLAVLRRLAHPDPGDAAYGPLSVVVAPVRALLQPLTKGLGDLVPVALRAGDERP
ncbi:MAG: transcription-repair coupling factor, partial [Dermatophilaceae bacterium]|nr:transcription-repair coupling factor [Dermatophilaceae bacterium]